MASYYKLQIEDRLKIGSSSSRSLRRMGKTPINYYYKGESSKNLLIDQKELHRAIQSGQHVFEVSINNETVYVMIKDAQYNPVTEEIIHLDLMRVRRTEKMIFSLPLVFEGTAVGSVEGGIVTQVSSAIDIECFPTDVPESILVDISDLELNEVIMANESLESNTKVKEIEFVEQIIGWRYKLDFKGRSYLKQNYPKLYSLISKFNERDFKNVFRDWFPKPILFRTRS